ncbi:transposase family protein [Streptomyces sp. NPDC000133]|uniref:transposase family protein n=1 Tax=Streptomyces sp. NPDC000133 TaxID=3364535 RepID=UPI0036AD2A56
MVTVFSGLSVLVVEDVTDGGDAVVITARTPDVAVPCPFCGTPTAKVHGYHGRTVTDVPVDGRQVVVHLRVRRLVCPVPGCRRHRPGRITRPHTPTRQRVCDVRPAPGIRRRRVCAPVAGPRALALRDFNPGLCQVVRFAARVVLARPGECAGVPHQCGTAMPTGCR